MGTPHSLVNALPIMVAVLLLVENVETLVAAGVAASEVEVLI